MSRLNIKLECFESLDSTNTYLKTAAKNGAPEGACVIANTQTKGRGRMGRSFVSQPGLGVYMSLLLRPDCPGDCVQSLTANTAVAVCRALCRLGDFHPEIKWVNDIYLGGKKICGILCESAISERGAEYAIIGIGVNLITRVEDFPPDLRETAGSVYTQSGVIIERGRLISALLTELDTMYSLWDSNKSVYLDEYRKNCTMLGHRVTVYGADGETEALAEEITDDFGLKVRFADNSTRILHSGEVSVKQG